MLPFFAASRSTGIGRDRDGLVLEVVFDRLDVVLVDVDAAIELLADLRVVPDRRRAPEHLRAEVERGRERHHRRDEDDDREAALGLADEESQSHARSRVHGPHQRSSKLRTLAVPREEDLDLLVAGRDA